MTLPSNEVKTAETSLNIQRENILAKKIQLLNDFRNYAAKKFKQLGIPFEVKYNLINGREDLKFNNLKIGDPMNLDMVKFDFDPKKEIISNYVMTTIIGNKQIEDFEKNMHTKGAFTSCRKKQISNHPIKNASPSDQQRLATVIERKVDKLLVGILKGDLVFDDEEYKELIDRNNFIERELKEIETRISVLGSIGNNSEIVIEETPKKR